MLVKVAAAGIDRGVWHLVTGLPYVVRLAGYGLRKPKSAVLGMDVAGRVQAVGAAVTRFRTGDAVFGTCDGAFAEYASAEQHRLAPAPENIPAAHAAAIPVSGLAALRALRVAGVCPGHSVLISGAAGGVGSFAVQIAKARGAHVSGVCSTTKTDFVEALGADRVIDYTNQDFTDALGRYDVILDLAGNRPLARLSRALAPDGTLVIVGGESGGRWLGGIDRTARAVVLGRIVRQRLTGIIAKQEPRDLEELKRLVESGEVTPAVHRRLYGLGDVPDAIRDLVAGRVRGKAVVTV